MAFQQSDLDNITAALGASELTVEVEGRRVTYRSLKDLQTQRALIAAELSAAASASASATTRRGSYRVTFATHRGD